MQWHPDWHSAPALITQQALLCSRACIVFSAICCSESRGSWMACMSCRSKRSGQQIRNLRVPTWPASPSSCSSSSSYSVHHSHLVVS